MTVRVALVGYGYAGRIFHAPLIRATDGLELSAISSQRPEAVHADLPDVLVVASAAEALAIPSVDLVVIATPNDTHAPLATAALAAGKHVVVDKPLALTLAEARGLAELAQRTDRVLATFHNRRWDGDFLALREVVVRSVVGDVTHFESHFDRFRPQVRARWREQPGAGSGLWYDLGPHLVDQALQLFGLPDRVLASFAAQRAAATTTDWAHVVLEYGPRRAILHASVLAAARVPRFIVHGALGSWIKYGVDRQEHDLVARVQSSTLPPADPERAIHVDGATGHEHDAPIPAGDYTQLYAQIRDAVRGRGPNPVPPAQSIAVTAVIEAAIRSSVECRALPLPLTDREISQLETGP